MSEREITKEDPQVSPYLLRPARTYEEYLRDRAIADRLQKQFENGPAISVTVTGSNKSGKTHRPAWNHRKASAEPALAVTGETDRRDSANNQT